MVQVETAQLIAECNEWRQALRISREAFTNDRIRLQEAATIHLSRTQLQDVEHLHNQIHIQLINIHDLKQAIKSHGRKIDYELNVHKGKVRRETFAEHEVLQTRFADLNRRLDSLRAEFERFLKKVQAGVGGNSRAFV